MLKMILGILAGFIVWSILWVGTGALFTALSPDWYGKNMTEFQNAVAHAEPFSAPVSMLILALTLSIFCSIASGFTAAVIAARKNSKLTFILGILLLLAGLPVEIAYWNYFPAWYHLAFLALLIPVTILGGKLSRSNRPPAYAVVMR